MKRRVKPISRKQDLEVARRPLPPALKWLFRFVAMSLPLMLLGLIELGLRLASYGYDPAFFKQERGDDGKTYLINNDEFTFRFFPREQSRCAQPFKIDVVKKAGVRRIFILGESAAMGDPQPSLGPGHILNVLLREKFPGEKFEIVNLGITAINSHVILPIAQEVAARGLGDIWILYIGNNEMVGPFGAATAFGNKAASLPFVKLNIAVQRTRVGQAAVALMRRFANKTPGGGWGGMEMFLENQIPPDNLKRETIYTNFEKNFAEIAEVGINSGAQVLLCTVSVNLRDCPPFGSLHTGTLTPAERQQFEKALTNGMALMSDYHPGAAIENFQAAAKIDADFAEMQFRWAQCLLQMTNHAAAREHFQIACDTDALPFRADTPINSAIRALGKRLAGEKLLLCDAEKEMSLAANDGVAGEESFFEHVHFNFDGNYRLARIWAEHLTKLLPQDVQLKASDGWASQDVCERAIGLSDWNRMSVISVVGGRIQKPPLSAQFTNPQRIQKLQDRQREIVRRMGESNAVASARAEFSAEVDRSPDDHVLRENFGVFLKSVADKTAALEQYQKITSELPHDFYSRVQIGKLLGELGRFVEAQSQLNQAAAQRPYLPDAWFELGVVQAASSNHLAALENFQRATRLQPADISSRTYSARMLWRLNRNDEAVREYRNLIKLNPNRWESHLELAELFATSGKTSDAIPEYQEAVRLNHLHPGIRLNLGVMLARQNRFDEAAEQFQAALTLSPTNAIAADHLRQVNVWRQQKRRLFRSPATW
jgi:tetratricopeptide (TPR) repeat protein